MDFEHAKSEIKSLKQKPTNDELLELYSLFKQATFGDAHGRKPGVFHAKARAKFSAWEKKRGIPASVAKLQYIICVKQLIKKYS